MRVERTQLVKAPREKVFQAWTDYEAYRTWDHQVFTSVTVKERAGNTARLDMETKFMGLRMPRTETHILTPPERVEVDGSVPIATNTTVWKFDAVPEGTRLTAILEIQLKGILKVLEPVAGWQARTLLGKWMEALANYVEAQ